MRPYLCLAILWALDRLGQRTPPVIVLEEIQALREEVSRTRTVVFDLENSAGECSWQLWFQGWLLRLSGVADLILVIVLVRGWLSRPHFQVPPPEPLPALISGTAAAEPEPQQQGTSSAGVSETSTTTDSPHRVGRSRPTRPSDLRAWRTSH